MILHWGHDLALGTRLGQGWDYTGEIAFSPWDYTGEICSAISQQNIKNQYFGGLLIQEPKSGFGGFWQVAGHVKTHLHEQTGQLHCKVFPVVLLIGRAG